MSARRPYKMNLAFKFTPIDKRSFDMFPLGAVNLVETTGSTI